MLTLILSLAVLLIAAASPPAIDYDFRGRGSVVAVEDLFRRLLNFDSTTPLPFAFELVDSCSGSKPDGALSELCFELIDSQSNDNHILLIRGTSGPDLAYGAAYYLRTYCDMSFSWERGGGNQVHLPSSWPAVRADDASAVQWRRRDISYGFNVCTFSYSQVCTAENPISYNKHSLDL